MHAVRWLASPRQGRCFLRGWKALLNDFWYFWSYKSTIKEKLLYDSSLSEFFSLVRKERKGQKEESIPLLNTFCRLAATSANKVPRPSHCSLATATGSKRLSADSDSPLCHVGLWRTSRFRFGCASVCEHSKIRVILIVSSAQVPNPRPPHLYMRACRQCVHESARLSRALCSHAWYSRNRGKQQNYRFLLYSLSHALATHYFLRLTRARRQWFGRRTA